MKTLKANDNYTKYKLLKIDAWSFGGCWNWGANYVIEDGIYINDKQPLKSRYILKMLREMGHLTDESKGRLAVSHDDRAIIEIVKRSTGEPIFALALSQPFAKGRTR